jgi:GAF domain-containing protein
MTPNSTPKQGNNFFADVTNLLIAPHPTITDASAQRYASLATLLSLASLILICIEAISSGLRQNNLQEVLQGFSFTIVGLLIAYILTRTKWYRLGTFIFIFSFASTGPISIINHTSDNPIYTILLYVPLGLIIGGIFLLPWELFLLVGLIEGVLFSIPLFGGLYPENYETTAGIIAAIGVSLIVLNNFRANTEQARIKEIELANSELNSAKDNLEARITERTDELNRRSTQLEAAALVARSAAEVRDLQELLESVVDQITTRFGFYHTGIFLTDASGQFVILQAASSEGGRRMLARGHRLEIGRQGIVGFSAHQKRPRIAQDVGTDSAFFNNPDLPETHSEIALPLIVRNRVIGVLDIQSKDNNAFSPDEVYTLQTMADQIALAIENARLIEESRTSIQQLENLTAENTGSIWKHRLQEQVKGYFYTPLGITPLTSGGDENISKSEDKSIEIPVNLRGKNIGIITLKRKPNEASWSEAEREMADRIASQIALAVENARLLEDSQRRALREQTVNEFSNRFSRSLDVDTLLQNAVRELHRLPQVAEVTVYVNPSKENDKTK